MATPWVEEGWWDEAGVHANVAPTVELERGSLLLTCDALAVTDAGSGGRTTQGLRRVPRRVTRDGPIRPPVRGARRARLLSFLRPIRQDALTMANQRELEGSIHVDLKRQETYGGYLQLDRLLHAQAPRSSQHDELLFIIQHQTSELWMKLMLHELDAALAFVKRDELEPCFKIFARVAHIQRMLFEQWAVLETMTPSEYLTFRDALGRSSGFQSYQYRAIEFMLGNKDENLLLPHRDDSEVHAWLKQRLEQPSLYDEFLRLLARKGYPLPKDRLERDFTKPYLRSDAVVAVFKAVYEAPEQHWEAYEMAEKLVDVEERFQLWRFRHMKTVHRIIGHKKGTGGSSGVTFLKRALDLTFFPELWDVRTELTPPPSAKR